MKYFLLIYSLLILPFTLNASQDDIFKSKGTTQGVIVQLMPSPAQKDVSRYTKIEASFNVPLDAKHVKKYDVKLKCLSCKKKKNIKGTVGYIEADKKVTFTPAESLSPGVYEVEFKSLKADKAHKKTKIKEIKYRFVVVEEVLERLTIVPATVNLIEGETLQLTVTGKYDNGIEKEMMSQVAWIVGDSQTITVDDNGLTSALKAGNTSIKAKLTGVLEAGEVVSNDVPVEVLIPDIVPPVITLNGEKTMTLHQDAIYEELGATALDERDGEVNVTITGTVDTSIVGNYTITYSAQDSVGNEANITRGVTVIDVTPPVLTLNGEANITLEQNANYTELGATAVDAVDGNVSVTITGTVETSNVGNYRITYSAVDKSGNESNITRSVIVIDVTPPVITLNGESIISLFVGQSYAEEGAIAVDLWDGNVSVDINGTVDTTTPGSYTVTYTATDNAGNSAQTTRIVNIVVPQLVSLSLESNVSTLLLGEKASLILSGKYEDNSTKQLTEEIEWIFDPSGSVEITGMVLTVIGGEDTTVQAKVDSVTSNALHFTIIDKPSFSVNVPDEDSNITIEYNHITLKAETTNTDTLTAVNQTLSDEHNRTIRIKGADNGNGVFYLYNIPLVKGTNEINVTAESEYGTQHSKIIILTSDANSSAPIGMRATEYTAIQSLQTTIEIGTLLSVQEYLFDVEGDGIIDEIHTPDDSNFTVNLTEEDRYKPRVTIRTTDDLLYSSGTYALSLDVKTDENQTDPKGFEAIDMAKTYVQAIIDNDRKTVERLLGHNPRLVGYIYNDPRVQPFLAETYSKITSWEQKYHDSGYASVKILFDANGTQYGGGFEMNVANPQVNTGRYWFIRFFY